MKIKEETILKGLASIIIIMCHMDVKNIFTPCGYLVVGIFYFFSAYNLCYCTTQKENYLDGFITKKFVSIFLPFYMMIVLYQVVSSWSFKVSYLYRAFMPKYDCEYLWYIKSLIYIYIVYYIVFSIMKKINKTNYTALGWIVWAVSGICMLTYTQDPNRFMPFAFLAGWFVFLNEEKVKNFIKGKYILVIIEFIIIIALHLLLYFDCKNVVLYILAQWSVPCICGLFCYSVSVNVELNNKFLLGLGKISMEVYLVHSVVLKLLRRYKMNNCIYVLAYFVGIYVMALLLNRIISKLYIKKDKQYT